MKAHEMEFKILTRDLAGNGKTRIDLFKVINGEEKHLLGPLRSYKEGADYLENDYMREYTEVVTFCSLLKQAIKERISLFDFDPPEWYEGFDSSLRHIPVEYKGRELRVEVDVMIKTGYGRILEATADAIEVLNDDRLQSIIERLYEDVWRIFDRFFTEIFTN